MNTLEKKPPISIVTEGLQPVRKMAVVVGLLALLMLSVPAASAKSTLTVNPLGLLVGAISVEYETEIGTGGATTLAVPVMFWGFQLPDLQLHATGIGGGMRYYPGGVAHEGLYFGGYGQFVNMRGTSGGSSFTGTALGITGTAGYKWNFANGFVIDLGVGVGFPLSINVSAGNLQAHQLGGSFGTAVGLGLGFSF